MTQISPSNVDEITLDEIEYELSKTKISDSSIPVPGGDIMASFESSRDVTMLKGRGDNGENYEIDEYNLEIDFPEFIEDENEAANGGCMMGGMQSLMKSSGSAMQHEGGEGFERRRIPCQVPHHPPCYAVYGAHSNVNNDCGTSGYPSRNLNLLSNSHDNGHRTTTSTSTSSSSSHHVHLKRAQSVGHHYGYNINTNCNAVGPLQHQEQSLQQHLCPPLNQYPPKQCYQQVEGSQIHSNQAFHGQCGIGHNAYLNVNGAMNVHPQPPLPQPRLYTINTTSCQVMSGDATSRRFQGHQGHQYQYQYQSQAQKQLLPSLELQPQLQALQRQQQQQQVLVQPQLTDQRRVRYQQLPPQSQPQPHPLAQLPQLQLQYHEQQHLNVNMNANQVVAPINYRGPQLQRHPHGHGHGNGHIYRPRAVSISSIEFQSQSISSASARHSLSYSRSQSTRSVSNLSSFSSSSGQNRPLSVSQEGLNHSNSQCQAQGSGHGVYSHSHSNSHSQSGNNNINHHKECQRQSGAVHFPASDLCGRYEFVSYLGHGSYGHVCEARSLVPNTGYDRVAIKKVPNVFRSMTDAKRLLREIVILRLVRVHQVMITLIEILPPKDIGNIDSLYLVFEFVDTDLSKLIRSPQNFEKLHSQHIIYQILLGLKYLHSANIVHRDLKPANILVNENVRTKICDFGLARGIMPNATGSAPVPLCHGKIRMQRVFGNESTSRHSRAAKGKGGGGGGGGAAGGGARSQGKAYDRQLTRHVVTRWYRAPEVILLSQRRECVKAIDMWSVGCILSELLMMVAEGDTNIGESRKPLFPGRSCFPLSAKRPEVYKDRLDQLNCIFSVIGTPTEEEIAKLEDEEAKAYVRQLRMTSCQPAIDWSRKFPSASKQEIDLLRRLLQFDVDKRITVDQALSHPYLEDVRDLQAEVDRESIFLPFEDVDLDMQTIYELVVDEVIYYNPQLLEGK